MLAQFEAKVAGPDIGLLHFECGVAFGCHLCDTKGKRETEFDAGAFNTLRQRARRQ